MFRNSFFFYFRTKKNYIIIKKNNDLTYSTDTTQIRNCPVTI